MLGRRTDEVAALRALISAIDNAQAITLDEPSGKDALNKFGDASVEMPRKAMSEADLRTLLTREIAARRTAADEYRSIGHPDQADRMSREAEIIASYVG